MENKNLAQLETRVQLLAAALPYPPTPDLARAFASTRRSRPVLRWGWAMAGLLAVLASLLAVPSVRARVLDFLQIGGVRIQLPQLLTAKGAFAPKQKGSPKPEDLVSVLDLDGETTLADARQQVTFPIDLPSFPLDLGDPDRVFLQHMDTGDFVVLAWLDESGEPRLIEYVLGPGVHLLKGSPDVISETLVNGNYAVWTTGEYLLQVEGFHQPIQFVPGPVLIWAVGPLTYRLEAPLSMEELVHIAESIGK